MAKFGEGDPRWLVADRADGTNVNAWHWVEKDALHWSQIRLAELFNNWEAPGLGEGRKLTVTGVDSVTGEAVVNNRKNKIIVAYELEIKFNWEGSSDGQTAKGKIHLPYVADENHDEDPEIRFALSVDDAPSTQLKAAFFGGEAKKAFTKLIAQFVKELRAGGPATHPSAASASTAAPDAAAAPKVKLTSADPREVAAAAAAAAPKASKSKKGRSLNLTEQFYCRAMDIYDCFTQEGRLRAFTQSPATTQPTVGGTFSWFGGSVQGTFTELEPGRRICMDWRFSSWEDDCVSKVVLSLEEPEPGHTVLTLAQTGIPEADKFGSEDVLVNTEKGWKVQLFQRIRQVFGYGLGL